ncbi:uncharacterized protein LOC102731656 [Leptonychotes weddellii]|uniref:Uncharacterized protein LOC102731656 n=1 Tax=Leptonychotes weddellii TaxID=9713 RepID=A0A7F8QCQ9_LEPWE|nr:uncharacterized protein LOC102731656 [Leptonychotes weddellii]
MSVYVLSQGSSNISTLLLSCYVVKQKCSDSKDYSERWIETGEKETGEQQCLTEVIKSFNVNNTWNKELWGTMVIDINMAGHRPCVTAANTRARTPTPAQPTPGGREQRKCSTPAAKPYRHIDSLFKGHEQIHSSGVTSKVLKFPVSGERKGASDRPRLHQICTPGRLSLGYRSRLR